MSPNPVMVKALSARSRRWLESLGAGLVAAALAVAAGHLPLAESFNRRASDRLLAWTAQSGDAHRDIVLVEIDETSLRRLEPLVGRWPWPRLVHAQVVEFLSRAHTRVIVYDVLFLERDRRAAFDAGGVTWSGAESDAALAESIAAAGNVVLPADAVYGGLRGQQVAAAPAAGLEASSVPEVGPAAEARPVLEPPLPQLARAARRLGHNLMVVDSDGPVRWWVPAVRSGDITLTSLGLAAFMELRAGAPIGVRRQPNGSEVTAMRLGAFELPIEELGSDRRRSLIRFRGPALDRYGHPLYRTVSFYDLFYSEEQLLAGMAPLVDPASFENTSVIVGTSAAGLHDVYAVAVGGRGQMTGPQVHAQVLDQLLSGRGLRRTGGAAVVAATVLAGIAAATAMGLLPLAAGLGAVTLAGGALVALGTMLFERGLSLPLVQPLLALATGAFLAVALNYLTEGREKRRVKTLFARYLSPDVYQQVLANPALAELGGHRREMTVLFSDVRGFTALTERADPEALVEQLNEYFSRMVDVVFHHQGTLDKFVGDMVMALFGAPLEDAAHAVHAVDAALDMASALDELNREWSRDGRPTFGIRIGISTGEMIAGNIGSSHVQSYTVVGDVVNLGARLEALNKDFGTTILVSDTTAAQVNGAFDLKTCGVVTVKGREAPVEVFEVRGRQA